MTEVVSATFEWPCPLKPEAAFLNLFATTAGLVSPEIIYGILSLVQLCPESLVIRLLSKAAYYEQPDSKYKHT